MGCCIGGGYIAYDAQKDQTCGSDSNYLKGFYPYYKLMWSVNSAVTEQFIESLWASHILDWSNLDMDRIGPLDKLRVVKGWDHEYKGGPVFLESDSGGSFFNAGTDLICAAAWLTKMSGKERPLVWARRLANRYVDTRHPNTGISHLMYRKPSEVMQEHYDDVLKKLVPGTEKFLPCVFLGGSNPILRKCIVGCRSEILRLHSSIALSPAAVCDYSSKPFEFVRKIIKNVENFLAFSAGKGNDGHDNLHME